MTTSEALTKLRNQRISTLVFFATTIGLVGGILKFAEGGTTVLSAIFFGASVFAGTVLLACAILVPIGAFATPPPDASPPAPTGDPPKT